MGYDRSIDIVKYTEYIISYLLIITDIIEKNKFDNNIIINNLDNIGDNINNICESINEEIKDFKPDAHIDYKQKVRDFKIKNILDEPRRIR